MHNSKPKQLQPRMAKASSEKGQQLKDCNGLDYWVHAPATNPFTTLTRHVIIKSLQYEISKKSVQ